MRITLLAILLSCPVVFLSPIPPQSFRDDVVRRHNEYRAKHGVGPVKENPALTLYAQEWADTLVKYNKLEHRKDLKYGENLAFYSATATGREYVDMWYIRQEKDYRQRGLYGTEPSINALSGVKHFTQVVWKGSTEIGIGKAGGYVVVNYNPPGNVDGLYKYNVLRPKA